MGAEQSTPVEEDPSRSRQLSSGATSSASIAARALPSLTSYKGYHVLKVQDGSPADDAGLEPYFDYIVSMNKTRLDEENSKLMDIIASNMDRPISLEVYSAKSMLIRRVTLIPSRRWGGDGVLGCSVRFCDFEHADEMIFHANSPAEAAGLKTESDYIIGSPARPLASEDDFALLMASHDRQPLTLFVYNLEENRVRMVDIVPDSEWGGSGSLGCAIGHGLIHRIPHQAEKVTTEATSQQS